MTDEGSTDAPATKAFEPVALDETLTYNGRALNLQPRMARAVSAGRQALFATWDEVAAHLCSDTPTPVYVILEPGDATRYELLLSVVPKWNGDRQLYITRWRGEHDLVGGMFVLASELEEGVEFDLWMMEESKLMDGNTWSAMLIASALNVLAKAWRNVQL